MAFTPQTGTGFEPGSIEIIASGDRAGTTVALDGTTVHTGNYSLKLTSSYPTSTTWARFAVTDDPAELYVGVWVYPNDNPAYYEEISVVLSDGKVIGLRHYDAGMWDAYVDGVEVATGAVAHTASTWALVELHVIIDNSGTIESRINGIDDISYSGDTQPASSVDIDYVRLLQNIGGIGNSLTSYYDDLTYGTADWPGDIRYDAGLVPNADTVQIDWTPSSGSLNYAMVDEIPPSDADYVSAGSHTYKDLYNIADWSPATTYTIPFVRDWIRVKKDSADPCEVQEVVSSNGTESSGGSLGLTTSFAYYSRILTTDPDTGLAWTESGIDALQIGQEYV